jgi:hypothetical protein
MRKKVLFVLFGVLLFLAALVLYAEWSVRASRLERTRVLPGDELIPQSIGVVTHAITIHGAPPHVWPWLVQMGSDRAGWYAFDFIDNGGHPSAQRILPQFQDIQVGTVFPALPGAKDVFVVAQFQPYRSLVLAWRSPSGAYLSTWSFSLDETSPGTTRLITRGRAGPVYRPFGLPPWVTMRIAPLAHLIMERKQLRGIARRAESRP